MFPRVYLRSDGIEHKLRGDDWGTVGYICKRYPHSPYARVSVSQGSVNWHSPDARLSVSQGSINWHNWCASNWVTIPHDDLWTVCTPDEALLSKVQVHNLDFIGTPFEHRYNEFVFRRKYWSPYRIHGIENISALAKRERETWGRYYETFVPFKKPNPQGYQGVWGNFDILLSSRWYTINVYDTFDLDIHTLQIGHT